MVDGFAELTLETSDIEGAERFYTEIVGLRVISREDDRVWLAAGRSARLGLWSPGEKEFDDRGGAHVHYAFSVTQEDLDALTQRLEDAGVDVEGPEDHPGGDRSVYFEDPAGNRVEAWDFFTHGKGARDGVDAI